MVSFYQFAWNTAVNIQAMGWNSGMSDRLSSHFNIAIYISLAIDVCKAVTNDNIRNPAQNALCS